MENEMSPLVTTLLDLLFIGLFVITLLFFTRLFAHWFGILSEDESVAKPMQVSFQPKQTQLNSEELTTLLDANKKADSRR